MARRVIAPGHSCLECRRRKIKCDRALPCSYCARIKLQCLYPLRRPDRSSPGESNLAAKVQALECTLQSLEQKITRIGDLSHVNAELYGRQDHSERGQQFSVDDAHDLPSSNQLSPRNNSQSHSNQYNVVTRSSDSPLLQSLPFNSSVGASQPLATLHPPSSGIAFIWQTYLDAVDPLLKIFHVPSVQRHVMSISQGREIPDAATECLMFAIYYSTVITISVAECREEFGEEKPRLLQRYQEGVERALVRANFLTSKDITVLQAFVIYLICGRVDENGPDIHALIGLAIGNAMKLGLHIDIPGMPSFEVEMRRRLWWQICTLDVRVAESSGSEPFIIEPSLHTELPLSINDISLDPHIGELSPQPGRSEMLFSLVRCEVSHFSRRIVFSDRFCRINKYEILDEAQKCQAIDQFKERIEKQYLSHCHEAIPLDCLTAMGGRLILAKLKLAVYKPRPDEDHRTPLRDNYRKACEKFLEHAHQLRQHSKECRWQWLFQYIEWDALAYLLLDVCITLSSPNLSPNGPIAGTWRVVNGSYNHWKSNPDVHRDRRWMKVEKLYSNALSVLERTQNVTQTCQTTPSYCYRGAHDQSEDLSDDAVQMQQQYESSPGSVSAEEAQASVNTTELPGAGTACEWSVSLIETYWDVAGPGNERF